MHFEELTEAARQRRKDWVIRIEASSAKFGADSTQLHADLLEELQRDGITALLEHLRVCGAIPEHFGHDSSEEKLYSKYTDALLSIAYQQMGLTSLVLSERADAADVEAVAQTYSLVADAKAFRLSRTAKNQKDFKVDAMHGWKRGKPHAMVVCPIYQLPTKSSQIYQQAIARKVCIFSYSHIAVLVAFAAKVGKQQAQDLLLKVLNSAEDLLPSKDAVAYWASLNRAMLQNHRSISKLWQIEKLATIESVAFAKEEALTTLSRERERIMRMSHQAAILELIRFKNIDGREKTIRALRDGNILSIA